MRPNAKNRPCVAMLAAVVALLAILGAVQPGYAAESRETPNARAAATQAAEPARPRIALVLSGGGARGIAHIGVLKVIESLRIPVDCIAGTSMGGLVGAIYASGTPLAEMEGEVRAIDWAHVFNDRPDRRDLSPRRRNDEDGHFARPEFGLRDYSIVASGGALHGQNMSALFEHLAARGREVRDFAKLPIPFQAMATDIETGQSVVLDRGSLATAMRATMSVPGVMAAERVDGRPLVDGGLVNNLPVAEARRACGDVVIAVNLGTPLLKAPDIRSAITVGMQVVNILTETNVQASLARLGPSDVLIEPKLGDIDFGDFDRVDELISIGTAATRAAEPALRRLALTEDGYAAWRASRERPAPGLRHFEGVRVTAQRHVNPDALIDPSDLTDPSDRSAAGVLDEDSARRLVARIYRRGDFERVRLRVEKDETGREAVIDAEEKSWGPDYLRFGISMSAQTGETTYFNAVASHRRTWINRLGAEWENTLQIGQHSIFQTQFIQPLGVRSPFFVAPRLTLGSEEIPVYVGTIQAGRLWRRTETAGADIGVELAGRGDLRAGMQWGREITDDNVGVLLIDEPIVEETRSWSLRGEIDQLDSAHFARNGHRIRLEHVDASNRPTLPHRRSHLSGTVAGTWSGNTFSAHGMRAHVDGVAPFADRIVMGGFQQLSGYPAGRFRADDVRFVRLGYQHVIRPPLGLELGGIVSQFYAGGTVEGARIEQSLDKATENGLYRSGSLYIGADTFLGPVFFALGKGSGERPTVWLSIGVPWSPR